MAREIEKIGEQRAALPLRFSDDLRNLVDSMLTIDSSKRITINEIFK